MHYSLSLIVIFLALCLPTIAKAKPWRGIVPLKSTRADVERLLGLPGEYGRYQFDEERASIDYAGKGPCDPVNTCLCFVSENTVISIHVTLEVEMRFSSLNIDRKKYEKHVSPQNPNLATYSNDEEGIIYTVNQEDDDVTAIEYLPTAKNCKEIIRSGKPTGVENLRRKTRCPNLLNANGSNQTRLTFSGSDVIEDQPVWSPDGYRIAFVSTRDSVVETWQETDDDGGILTRTRLNINKEIYLMNSDGTNQLRLINSLGNDDSPVWSRDGTKLLFRSDRERDCCDPVAQVWVMFPDGSNQLNLSNSVFNDFGGSW